MKKDLLPNLDIVTIALYILGNGTKSFDKEEIATKADEIAPIRFRWKTNSNMISDGLVWDALSNARKKGYVLENTAKYLLTEEGIKFAQENIHKIKNYDQTRSRYSKKDKEVYENTKIRILNSGAYSKAIENKLEEVNANEFQSFFRINEYMDNKQIKEKIHKLKNMFTDDKDLKNVIIQITNEYERRVHVK
jgi:hypothetical protein